MGITITPYTHERVPAVRAFNRRLVAGGVPSDLCFPEEPAPVLAPTDGHAYEERFVALDAETVRGGYILRHHPFMVRGATQTICQYRLPVSEGIVDRTYVGVGFRLLRDALRTRPLLFALGMGGVDKPLPRMLQAAGWRLSVVRFYFKACHPRTVVATLADRRVIPGPPWLGGGAVAVSLGRLALAAIDKLQVTTRLPADVSWDIVDGFGDWADAVWQACAGEYGMIAVRSRERLNALYANRDRRFIIVAVHRRGAVIGWVVVLDTKMTDHRQFGRLRVGSIVDGLAASHEAPTVIGAASRLLDDRGVDLIVSNQAHAAWARALRVSGFLRGPSNFIFAASPALTDLLQPFDLSRPRIHLNRGDGDGPIHL